MGKHSTCRRISQARSPQPEWDLHGDNLLSWITLVVSSVSRCLASATPRSVFWRFWQKRRESLLGSLSSPPPKKMDFLQSFLWEHLCPEEP